MLETTKQDDRDTIEEEASSSSSANNNNSSSNNNNNNGNLIMRRSLSLKTDLAPIVGLRGISAVVVVIGTIVTFWLPFFNRQDKYPVFGIDYLQAITLFFVVSGFTLVHVYGDGVKNDFGNNITVRDFFVKRIARLAPMYYIGLAISIPPLLVYGSLFDIISSFIISPLFLQSIVIIGSSLNPPLWTCSALIFCYLTFPFFLRRLDRIEETKILYRIVFILYLGQGFAFLLLSMVVPFYVLHISFLMRLPQFLVGMCMAIISQRQRFNAAIFVAEFCSLTMLFTFITSSALGHVAGGHGWISLITNDEWWMLIVHGFFVASISEPDCKGITKRFLNLPPIQYLGRISFSIYILHSPLIHWYAWLKYGDGTINSDSVPRHTIEGVHGYFDLKESYEILIILIIVIVFAAVSHHLIESPVRRLINNRFISLATATELL